MPVAPGHVAAPLSLFPTSIDNVIDSELPDLIEVEDDPYDDNDGSSKAAPSAAGEDIDHEGRIQAAIRAIHAKGKKDDGTWVYAIRAAAKDHDVPRETLRTRLNGVRARKDAHEHERALTAVQEDILVSWASGLAKRGLPITLDALQECASHIAGREVGKTWPKRFVARHPEIKMKWTTSLEKCRAASLNRTVVEEFHQLIEDLISDFSIIPKNIYNMDEKGI